LKTNVSKSSVFEGFEEEDSDFETVNFETLKLS